MVGATGYAHLLIFGVLIPLYAIRSMKLIESRALPPRQRYFVSALIQTGLLAMLSLLVGRLNWIEVFPRTSPPPRAIAGGCAFLAIAIPFGWTRWRKAVLTRKKIVALFMPVTARERAFWTGIAIVAGVGEEITWRGVQTILLTRLMNDSIAAVIVCVLMFAIAHAIQGWKSVRVIAIFAAGFHLLVWLAGSLYVAMAVHFIYDLIAGFSYGYLGRKLGYPIDQPAALPASDHSPLRAES